MGNNDEPQPVKVFTEPESFLLIAEDFKVRFWPELDRRNAIVPTCFHYGLRRIVVVFF
jgi:hypothetical protein